MNIYVVFWHREIHRTRLNEIRAKSLNSSTCAALAGGRGTTQSYQNISLDVLRIILVIIIIL